MLKWGAMMGTYNPVVTEWYRNYKLFRVFELLMSPELFDDWHGMER